MKVKKPTKKILIYSLSVLFVAVSAGVFYLLFIKQKAEELWYDSNWSYRKTVYIENIPREYRGFEEDVLIQLDTATLIEEGRLAQDCRDIRFVDDDNSRTLPYWIEGGCDTKQTQIWVKVKLPNSSEKIIYSYYGNELAVQNQETWNGAFITMQPEPCPEGCDITENFKGRFIKGAEKYNEISGMDSHFHSLFNSIDTEGCENLVNIAVPQEETKCDVGSDNMVRLNSTEVSNILPHEDMYFYRNFDGYLPPESIIIFDKPSPKNWSTFEPLVGKYPRGNDDTETEATNSHVHYLSCVNEDLYIKDGTEKYLSLVKDSHTIAIPVEPPFFNVNYISNSEYSVLPLDAIVITTEMPPLGWERYEQLDGYFPKGSTTNFKETGGNENHTHTSNFAIEVRSSTRERLNLVENTLACLNRDVNSAQKSSEESMLPINLGMIFGQKKGELSGTIGLRFGEEYSRDILGTSSTTPSKPTSLETEGLTNPTDLTTTSPGFTAIFNHPDYPQYEYVQ